jgi:hypothetical protein
MRIPRAKRIGGSPPRATELGAVAEAADVAEIGETAARGWGATPELSPPQLGQREEPAGTLLSHAGQRCQVESYRTCRSIPDGPTALTERRVIRPTTQHGLTGDCNPGAPEMT